MDRSSEPSENAVDCDEACAKNAVSKRLAGEVILFLHAGGLPIEAVARQLKALKCFGEPKAHFDLDGPMWSAVNDTKMGSFADYLISLIDWTPSDAGRLSTLIDYRDLMWLEQRPIFREQLRQRLRVVRLAFLDPALQALRRINAQSLLSSVPGDGNRKPGFAELARELVEIEEAELIGDEFCKRRGLPLARLWIEDLARPGVPALSGLLDRWSIRLPEEGLFLPIEPPSRLELESVAAFRAEADRRHWSHALLSGKP
ncbi:MAG: hypothetical protein ACR2QH_08965 [Geminicoccaceae bacterium]